MKRIAALLLLLAVLAAGCSAGKTDRQANAVPAVSSGIYCVKSVDGKSGEEYLKSVFEKEQSTFDGTYEDWIETFEMTGDDIAKMAVLNLKPGGEFELKYLVYPFNIETGTWRTEESTLILETSEGETLKAEIRDGEMVFDGNLAYQGAEVVFGR